MWEEQLIKQLKNKVKDYPTKALLEEMLKLSKGLNERLEHLQGQMDGQSWSPELWRNEGLSSID